jgi:hypothetical protein
VQTRWQWIVCVRESSKGNQMSTVGCPVSLLCSSCAMRILVLSLQRHSWELWRTVATYNKDKFKRSRILGCFFFNSDRHLRQNATRVGPMKGLPPSILSQLLSSVLICFSFQQRTCRNTPIPPAMHSYDCMILLVRIQRCDISPRPNNGGCWVRKAGGLETRKRTGGN